jgi:hypothetical protein
MTERCPETCPKQGIAAIFELGFQLGEPFVQCRLPAGHGTEHEADVQPFPGFASERMVWSTKALLQRTTADGVGWENLAAGQIRDDAVAYACLLVLRTLEALGDKDSTVTIDALTEHEVSYRLPGTP